MNEASKTHRLRSKFFRETFLSGKVLDIGSGPDAVPGAEPFDLEHGDVNNILRFKNPESYDCVHSSHCLEHMIDPHTAVLDWWTLVKPNGFLIIVVPDMELYEQGIWPSLFNSDHKWKFTLSGRMEPKRSIINIEQLMRLLPNGSIIQIQRQDDGYDYSLAVTGASELQRFFGRLFGRIRRDLDSTRVYPLVLDKILTRALHFFGIPVDQTIGPAVAQIEIVLQKGINHFAQ